MELKAEFESMLTEIGGPTAAVAAALRSGETPPPAVRVNLTKGATVPAGATPVPWCSSGYYLSERPTFTLDPALHQGLYYVQDASSMATAAAVAHAVGIVGDGSPLRCLDACAAPGGKTLAAADVLPAGSFILANEYDPRRAAVLRENVIKHGSGSVALCRADAASMALPAGFFDIICADVPCSGEGMMGKEEIAVEQWSPALVARCAALQRAITDNLWEALAPGGCLVYSTCTFNLDENERVVARLIDEKGAEAVAVGALQRPEIAGAAGVHMFPAYRFLPGRVQGHGQFVTLLRKSENDGRRHTCRTPRNARQKATTDVSAWLSGAYTGLRDGDTVRAIPTAHLPELETLSRSLDITYAGIETGTYKGRDLIPSQALAMAADLRDDAFPSSDVDLDTALAYLRHHPVTIDAPRGIVLLRYNGRPLGFVKNLGSRANNLYPAAWRILH